MRIRAIGAGIAGGMLAGALVGAVEAVVAWMGAHAAGELPPVAWAMVVYGAIGAAGGLGAGLLGAIIGGGGFGIGFGGILAGLGFVVGRFRVVRDVFQEQLPPGILTPIVQVLALVLAIALGVGLWRLFRRLDQRGGLTRPGVVATLIALVAIGFTVAGWLAPKPERVAKTATATAKAGTPPVILIAVDTLRADHLSAYGYQANKTPNIDGLASDGVRYAEAYAQASWTRPSFATIFTGQYPSSHGAVHKSSLLPDRIDTMAESLSGAGYYTVGFPNNVNISPPFNFGQGFDEYNYLAPDHFFYASEAASKLTLYDGLRLVRERFLSKNVNVYNYYQPAEVVTARVTEWLDEHGEKPEPFFLFVHYMDPHDPYFVHPFNGEGYARVSNPNPPADVADKYRSLYDGEISYLDEHVGALLAELKRRGIYDKALIVFTADHGEEFQDHGGWWHGTTLYDEQINIPLIVKHPQSAGSQVVTDLAAHVDILPTMLSIAGVDVPKQAQGKPLALAAGAGPVRDSVFAEEDLEGNVLQAVRTPEWSFISANKGNPRGLQPEELYQVSTDPGEKTDLASKDPTQLETMKAALGKAYLTAKENAGQGADTTIDAATHERLKQLGYAE